MNSKLLRLPSKIISPSFVLPLGNSNRVASTDSILAPLFTHSQSPYSTAAKWEDIPREHLRFPTPDDCQVLRLPDGRYLAYGEYGSQAANAQPIIFIHGIPDTRLDACLLPSDQAIAEKLNIRWIGIDRPGYGLSTFRPHRTVLGWVDDLKHLIHHLELESYRVLGVSGGTAYALACAKLLPRNQLRSAGIFIGLGPREAGLQGMSLLGNAAFRIFRYYPWMFRWLFDRYVVPKAQCFEELEKFVRDRNKNLPKNDRETLGKDEVVEGITRIWREVFRQGSARGYIEDSNLAMGDWGFRCEDIDYPGIKLWYGKEDVNTPPQMGRYMAARLPKAVLKEYDGKSHFTMWAHIEEVLTDLLQDTQG